MKAVIVGLALAASVVGAHGKTVHLRGAGNMECGAYLQYRKASNSDMEAAAGQWAFGYLSAYNMWSAGSGRAPVPQIPEYPTVLAYLDKHCRDAPLAKVRDGVEHLIYELTPQGSPPPDGPIKSLPGWPPEPKK